METDVLQQKIEKQEKLIEELESLALLLNEEHREKQHFERLYLNMKQSFERVNQELIEVYASKRWRVTEPLARLRKKAPAHKAEQAAPLDSSEQKRQKMIFVIDQYVPRYDQDAGSRSIFGYLRLFVEMGWRVVFMGSDFEGPEPYTARLRELGVEVLCGEYFRANWSEWVLQHADEIDVAFLNRPSIAWKFLPFIRENTKAKIIYFGHDLHFLREGRAAEVRGDSGMLEQAKRSRAIEHVVMKEADVVMMFNSVERDIIREEFGIEALVIPLFFFRTFDQCKTEFASTKDLLFVGGFRHAPNADGILWFVKEVFPSIQRDIPEIKLYIAGSHPTAEIKALASEQIVVTGFVPDDALEELYRTCRICVIPLRFGAGVKGKTVEAMFYGISSVSTSIGIEGMEHIETVIRPADTAEEFARQTIEKYRDLDVIEGDAHAYRDYLKRYASYESTKELFHKVFQDLGVGLDAEII